MEITPRVEAVGTMVPNAAVIAQLSIATPVRLCFSSLTRANVSSGTGVVCTGYTDTAIPRDI
jgi:hypothetical protein